jgi:uncharacterized protein (DUF3084 family)
MKKQTRSMKIQFFLEPELYFELERALKETKERISEAVKTDSEMIRYAVMVAKKHLENCDLNIYRLSKQLQEKQSEIDKLSDKITAYTIDNERLFKEKRLLEIEFSQVKSKKADKCK